MELVFNVDDFNAGTGVDYGDLDDFPTDISTGSSPITEADLGRTTLTIGKTDSKLNLHSGVLLKYDVSSIPANAVITAGYFDFFAFVMSVNGPFGYFRVAQTVPDGIWDDDAREAWRPSVGGYQESQDLPWGYVFGSGGAAIPGKVVDDQSLGTFAYSGPTWNGIGFPTSAGDPSSIPATQIAWGNPTSAEPLKTAVEWTLTNTPNKVISFQLLGLLAPVGGVEWLRLLSTDNVPEGRGPAVVVQFDILITSDLEQDFFPESTMTFTAPDPIPGKVEACGHVIEAVSASGVKVHAVDGVGVYSGTVEGAGETLSTVSADGEVLPSVSSSGEVC